MYWQIYLFVLSFGYIERGSAMKVLEEKIREECNISKKLREGAWEEKDFHKSMQLREKQQEHWEKFNFLKELSKAIERKEN